MPSRKMPVSVHQNFAREDCANAPDVLTVEGVGEQRFLSFSDAQVYECPSSDLFLAPHNDENKMRRRCAY